MWRSGGWGANESREVVGRQYSACRQNCVPTGSGGSHGGFCGEEGQDLTCTHRCPLAAVRGTQLMRGRSWGAGGRGLRWSR